MKQQLVNKATLLALVILISAVFLDHDPSIFDGNFHGRTFFSNFSPCPPSSTDDWAARRPWPQFSPYLPCLALVLTPLSVLLTLIVARQSALANLSPPGCRPLSMNLQLSTYLEKLPYYQEILPYRDIIIQKAGEMVGTISSFLIDSLPFGFTKLTIDAIFSSIIMLYVMFYFLTMGDVLLHKILFFLPLDDHNEKRLLNRFTSVTRATLKGTLIIGLMQGTICGVAFAIAGIEGPVFWGSLMAVMSIIPAFGTAIIWCPALLILVLAGNFSGAVF